MIYNFISLIYFVHVKNILIGIILAIIGFIGLGVASAAMLSAQISHNEENNS